jgi:hypothetical protein
MENEDQVNESAAQAVKSEKPTNSWMWIKDTSGHESVSVTFVTVAFWLTAINYVLSMFKHIGPVEIRAFDVGACTSFLVPFVSLYFGRKWIDASNGITQMRENLQATANSSRNLRGAPSDPGDGNS